MRFPRVLVVVPVWLLLTAETPSPTPPASSPSPSAEVSPTPTPSPVTPTPTPVNAFLSLDVTAGGPSTVINVTGGQFLPNEQMTLYWDTPNHSAGSATADSNGSFNSRVKPFTGDAPGVHKLCANVPPNPCANFALQPAASPTPSASPTPVESPSPSGEPSSTPTLVATPTRVNSSLSGFDVITRPPFVFLPIFGFGAIALSLLYWAVMVIRRPRRPAALASAAVVHRATRPDYSAGFGTPPPAPRQPAQPSAWDEPMRAGAVGSPAPTSMTPPGAVAPTPAPSSSGAPFSPGALAPAPPLAQPPMAQPPMAQPPMAQPPMAQPPSIGEPGPAVWSAGPAVPWGPGTPDAGYPELGETPGLSPAPPEDGDIPQPGD